MPYTLTRSNGTTLAIIQDGSIDNSTDITFVGKNYAGYGQTVNENFVKLLENFANSRQPAKPVPGQIWFDSGTLKVKFYDGSNFKALTSLSTATNRPSNLVIGDQWFDTVDKKLYVYDGTDFTMIGPEKSQNVLQSSLSTTSIPRAGNSPAQALQLGIGTGAGSTVAILSQTPITPDPASDVVLNQHFYNIQQGINLPGTSYPGAGIPNTSFNFTDQTHSAVQKYAAVPNPANPWIFYGGSSSAWGLIEADDAGGFNFYDSKSYVRRSEFGAYDGPIVINNDAGITIGLNRIIKLHVTNNYTGNLSNLNGQKINFNTTVNNTLTNVLSLDYNAGTLVVLPNPTQIVDLGATGAWFNNGYVKTLNASSLNTSTTGIISGVWTLSAGSQIVGGSVIATLATTSTNSTKLESYLKDGMTFVHAEIDDVINSAGSIVQRDPYGLVRATGIKASLTGTSVVKGNWIIDPAGGTFQATALLGVVGGAYAAADTTATNGTIVQRDAIGGVNATIVTTPWLKAGPLTSSSGKITGAWVLDGSSTLEATYADIAERYAADDVYYPGTVLVVGGEKEVTVTRTRANTKVAGIVSTNPAFKLNGSAGEDDTHPYIALKGRVPCKVFGIVKKGDRLVSSTHAGCAEAFTPGDDPGAVLGIALADNFVLDQATLIEVLVK